jgi:hypothetical protein
MPLTSIADLQTRGTDTTGLILRARKISANYDEFITLGRKKQERLPGIHASEVSKCKRKSVYSLLAYHQEEKLSKNWRQRFTMGHAIHNMIQTDFEEMAKASGGLMTFEREVVIAPKLQPIADKWFINSSADGIFTEYDEPGGQPILRYGLEIKSEAPDGYEKLREPREDHLEQAHIYMRCLDLPMIWFFYMNKGNQNNTDSMGSFFVLWNQDIWDKLEAKFQVLHDYAGRAELPPREESMGCQFCGFAYTCNPPSLTRTSLPQPGRVWTGR